MALSFNYNEPASGFIEMECINLNPKLLPGLTNLVNTQMAAIPPYWTFSEEHTARIIDSAGSLWSIHYPDQSAIFDLETFCVVDEDKLLAAAQWGYPVEHQGIDDSGILFWIFAEPGAVDALSLLLETIQSHSHQAGNHRIITTRFSFGTGWLGIPASWTAVIDALEAAEFKPVTRWQIFTSPPDLPEKVETALLQPVDISWEANEDALEWDLRIHKDGELVGECEAWGLSRHLSGCEGYSNWISIEWLGVEDRYRRQGTGRWLLREQLRRQADRGITHAILWTETNNLAMLGLNNKLGFQNCFESWDFEMVQSY